SFSGCITRNWAQGTAGWSNVDTPLDFDKRAGRKALWCSHKKTPPSHEYRAERGELVCRMRPSTSRHHTGIVSRTAAIARKIWRLHVAIAHRSHSANSRELPTYCS